MKDYREDYEKRLEELNHEARKLEATMLTYNALTYCAEHGHNFDYHYDEEKKTITGTCNSCGIYIEAGDASLWFDDELEEQFGELAGKSIEQIEMPAPSEETTEIDETPSLPMENTKGTDGTYRVDVSEILGKKKEE